MKKIVILGNSGSGKSTLTKKLADLLNMPYLHLDTIVWKHNWTENEYHEIENKIKDFIGQSEWICDGNFLNKVPERFSLCDTFIFLDIPSYKCYFRVIKRYFKYKNKPRESRSIYCNEKLSLDYLKWVKKDFKKQSRPRILEMLKTTDKKVIILKNKKEIKNFLISLSSGF